MRSRTALRYSRCSTGPRFLSVRYVPRSGAKKLGCRVVDEIGYPVFEKASSRKLFGRPEWAALWDLTSQQNGREATLLPPLRPAKVRDPEPSSHLPDVPEPSSGNAPSAHSGEWGGRTDWPGICRPIAPFRRCRGGAPAPWAPRGGAPGRSGRAGSPRVVSQPASPEAGGRGGPGFLCCAPPACLRLNIRQTADRFREPVSNPPPAQAEPPPGTPASRTR